jgi:NADPH-dependent ferric siderophore reductase
VSVEALPLPQSVLSIPGVQPLELEVVEASELGASMRRIVLTAPNLSELSYQPGQDVMLVLGQAGDRPLSRRYTIRSLDHTRRLVELNIVAHGVDGPGARWAEEARPGNRVNGVGPRGKIFLDPTADWHLFLGDASGAPGSLAMLEALPPDVAGYAFLKLETPLPHSATGKRTVEWLSSGSLPRALDAFALPAGVGHVYIAGEVQQVNALRSAALDRGLQPEHVSAKAYWGRGKPNAPRGEPEVSS